MDELRDEAGQKMESLNALANQVLKSYVTWYIPASKAGNYNVPKTLLAGIFEALTEEQTANFLFRYLL